MSRWPSDEPPPLPRSLLPQGAPREGSSEWEALFARVVAATEAELGTTSSPVHEGDAPVGAGVIVGGPAWLPVLASWWRPAAALAAAAAALALLTSPRTEALPMDGPTAGAVSLAVVTAQGDAAALFEGLGIPADPVLALIATKGGPR